MKRTKKQHFVPQCYLRRFVNSDGKLFAYDKKADKVYPTTPGDAAQEAYFYDILPGSFSDPDFDGQAIEKFLSRREAEYNPLITELINSAELGSFSHELVADFSPYVVLHWMRTKTYRAD